MLLASRVPLQQVVLLVFIEHLFESNISLFSGLNRVGRGTGDLSFAKSLRRFKPRMQSSAFKHALDLKCVGSNWTEKN